MGKLHLKIIGIKAKWSIWKDLFFGGCLYFMKLAFNVLIQRIAIIEIERHTVKSNGGFKYLSITISKLPISEKHEYEK